MRAGQNPAKFVQDVARPEKVTIAVLSYIPFLSGYYEQSLDILKLCLASIRENTTGSYDLLVFDNGSCQEVLDVLQGLFDGGEIQYLLLSSRNLGKVGAWNMILDGAPGEWVVFADSDIYFFPGWLSAHLKLFDHYPNVGTVTGLPRRRRTTYSEQTIERVRKNSEITLRQGHFIPEDWLIDHARSVGKLEGLDEELERDDFLLEYQGVQAYITAQHFQFMLRKEILAPYLPFEYSRPMGEDVANFDRAIEATGCLRLATKERTIMHMGNRLDPELLRSLQQSPTARGSGKRGVLGGGSGIRRLLYWPPIRFLLLGIYNRIFRLYYGR